MPSILGAMKFPLLLRAKDSSPPRTKEEDEEAVGFCPRNLPP